MALQEVGGVVNQTTVSAGDIQGLTEDQILLGASDGSAEQNSNLAFNSTTGILTAGVDGTGGLFAAGSIQLRPPTTPTNIATLYGNGHIVIGDYAMWKLADNGFNVNYQIAIGTAALQEFNPVGFGDKNIAIGHYAALNTVSGYYNVIIGKNAVAQATSMGRSNVVIGSHAGDYATTFNYANVIVGVRSGVRHTGYQNTFIGAYAGNATSGTVAGNNKIAIGPFALRNNSGDYNIGIGYDALDNTGAGNLNIAIGRQAGQGVTSGSRTVAIGYRAQQSGNATDNVSIGRNAGTSHSGSRSVLIGNYAGSEQTSSNSNIAIGDDAGRNAASTSNLIAIGTNAMDTTGSSFNITAAYNIAIGAEAFMFTSSAVTSNQTGRENIAIGRFAMKNVQGYINGSIAIGTYAGRGIGTLAFGSNNNVAIGNRAMSGSTTPTATSFGYGNVAIGAYSMDNTGANGNYNVAVGYQVLQANAIGDNNVGLGRRALTRATGNHNIGIGYDAGGDITSGSNNIAIGNSAMEAGTSVTGSDNIVIGRNAGQRLTSSSDNIFMGESAGNGVVADNQNIAIGRLVMGGSTATWGSGNTGVGYRAMEKIGTHGYDNVAIGRSALGYTVVGNRNVAIGYNAMGAGTAAGDKNTAVGARNMVPCRGDGNIGLGYYTAFSITTGNNNMFLGNYAGSDITTGSSNIFIGYNLRGNGNTSNELWVHNSDVATPLLHGYMASSSERLKINGTLEVSNVAEGGTGALGRKTLREAHTLAAANTSDTTINIPSGCRLIGAAFNVNTAVTTSSATNTWEAAFTGGSTAALAGAGTAGTLNTKSNDFVSTVEITSSTTNVRFTAPGAETFTAGVIEVVVWYEEFTSLANA